MKTIEREKSESRDIQADSDTNVVCEICGKYDAFQIGDRILCADCYQGCGSCCPEFGKDDLWTFPEDK